MKKCVEKGRLRPEDKYREKGGAYLLLPVYKRRPGMFRVYRVPGNLRKAAEFLVEFGTAWCTNTHLHLSANQYREPVLQPGDYVVFNEDPTEEYSVITYKRADFEKWFQRA